MKNKAPIILNCFSRGGSNILWNVLLSHPEVCSPIEETLQIFRFDWRAPRAAGLQAAWLSGQWNFFDQWNFQARKPISKRAQSFIDETLHQWKLKTLQDDEMRWKSKEEIYTRTEVESARLVIKNNNGIIFLSERFLEMYPDAAFLGLVRDPVPLYESHKRHKTPVSASPKTFAAFYGKIVRKMQADENRWKQYKIFHFEDLLREPVKITQQVYAHTGLELSKIPQMRFKAKPHMQANGSHATHLQEGKHYWFNFDEVAQILEPEVNQYQSSKLEAHEKEEVQKLTRKIREELGY
jgi:hypothetical protein